MKVVMKVIVTDLVVGKNQDYLNLVDVETGGVFSLGVPQGSARDLPRLVPVEIVADAKPGRYGLFARAFQVKQS